MLFSWDTAENKAPFSLKKKKVIIYPTEFYFGSLSPHPKWHLVAYQTLSSSERVQERTFVNPPSEKSVNVNVPLSWEQDK